MCSHKGKSLWGNNVTILLYVIRLPKVNGSCFDSWTCPVIRRAPGRRPLHWVSSWMAPGRRNSLPPSVTLIQHILLNDSMEHCHISWVWYTSPKIAIGCVWICTCISYNVGCVRGKNRCDRLEDQETKQTSSVRDDNKNSDAMKRWETGTIWNRKLCVLWYVDVADEKK